MHIKSIEDLKSTDSNNANEQTIKKIAESVEERARHRTYQELAAAVLLKRNLHRETKELAPILGDFTGSKNIVSVTNWLKKVDPDLIEFGEIEIQEYFSQLTTLIDEYMNP